MPEAGQSKSALFIALTDNPGGAERVTFSLASALAARPGWDVDVMILCSQLPVSFSKQALPPGVRIKYGLTRNPFAGFALLPFRLALRRYDLLLATHIYTNALASLMRRTGLLLTRRLVLRESMSLFDRFSGAKAKLFGALYRCYGGEDLLVAQTGYMAGHVRPRLPARSAGHLQVLPNPVDLEAIDRARAEPLDPAIGERLAGRRNILFCGRLVEFKRPGLALEAFHRLKDEGEEVQLVFLGTGPLETRLRAEAAQRGIASHVLFLGQFPNPYPVMDACQYGLLTSANEGFPNVVLEMMACAMKGIVMTPCAGDLESLRDVLVTRTHEPAEIAGALGAMLHSGADRGGRYRACAETRSPGPYLDALLGTEPASAVP